MIICVNCWALLVCIKLQLIARTEHVFLHPIICFADCPLTTESSACWPCLSQGLLEENKH